MFAVGWIEEGSSSVPARTTVSPARPVLSANRWLPHFGQNRRRTRLPLSAVLTYSEGSPAISIDAAGKIALTVPWPDRCWQSRHQQILAATGCPSRDS